MKIIDAHCHLEKKDFAAAEEVITRARQAGVVHAVVVGLMQESGDFGAAHGLAQQFPDFLTATMGIHPHDASAAKESDWVELERLCSLPEIVAVGEAGLDFFYNHSPAEEQELSFRRQCALAKKVNKPLVVHVRDAHDTCAKVLTSEGMSSGMIHCFTGDTEAARTYLDMGFHLSISGVVTYKKTESLQAAVQFAPIDRLMVETDSPFLSPIPVRGRKNEPANIVHTVKKIAELKRLEPEAVAEQCAKNTTSLLKLKVA